MKYGNSKYSKGKVKSTGTPTAGSTVSVCGDNHAKSGDMGYVDKGMMNAMGKTPLNKDYPTAKAPKPDAMAADKKISVSGDNHAK